MTKRADIVGGRLVYTCNCGFIDTYHATPDLAMRLLESIRNERQSVGPSPSDRNTIEGKPAFLLAYSQGMIHLLGHKLVSRGGYYLVRKGLPLQRKREVALAIFMEVSLGFEAMQLERPWGWGSDSGFSAEDLMSDLVAFYMAMLGLEEKDMRKLCGAVSREATLAVYDQNFPDGIGKVKVRRFLEPLFFACDECKAAPQLPGVFRMLKPADRNGDYIRVTTLPRKWTWGGPADFDRTGRPR